MSALGNGIAWWLEYRHNERAAVLTDGTLDLGREFRPVPRRLKVAKGDRLMLAIDARNGDHSCDLTEITLTITEYDTPGRVWDLANDVADNIHDGNPQADRHDNQDVWSFVKGPSKPGPKYSSTLIPVPPTSSSPVCSSSCAR